jgi:hypothetical protein
VTEEGLGLGAAQEGDHLVLVRRQKRLLTVRIWISSTTRGTRDQPGMERKPSVKFGDEHGVPGEAARRSRASREPSQLGPTRAESVVTWRPPRLLGDPDRGRGGGTRGEWTSAAPFDLR